MELIKRLIKSGLNAFGVDLVRHEKQSESDRFSIDFDPSDIEIIKKVQPFTYTSPERIHALCNAIKYISKNQIAGDIVECGVWKGGSIMAAILVMLELGDTSRHIYLYDTFEGMSEPTEKDISIEGKFAIDVFQEKSDSGEKWVYSALDEVKENVLSLGYDNSKIHFVKGFVEDTLPATIPESIALLRLDTDWYESTRHELIHLFPRLNHGGVLVIDDYGHWQGARKAVDEYIQEHHLKILLNRIDYTGRIAVKAY